MLYPFGQGHASLTLSIVFGTAPSTGGEPDLGSVTGPLALVAANLFVVFFGMSWGPVVWVLLGETFPNQIRAIALSVAAAVQWVANFVVSTTFPPLKDAGLGLAYGLYTASAAVSFVFVWFLVRETKGRADTLLTFVGVAPIFVRHTLSLTGSDRQTSLRPRELPDRDAHHRQAQQ